MKSNGLKEKIKEAVIELDLPAGAFFDLPRIEMHGDTSVLVEKHHGIVEYSDCCIRLAAKGMTVVVTGESLQLMTMSKLDISIKGKIQKVELIKQEK